MRVGLNGDIYKCIQHLTEIVVRVKQFYCCVRVLMVLMLMLMYEAFSDYWGGGEIFWGGWWGSCFSLFRAGEEGRGEGQRAQWLMSRDVT